MNREACSPRSTARSVRARTGVLAALCALMLADGVPLLGPGTGAEAAVEGVAAPQPFSAETVAGIVGSVNPELAPPQLRRIGAAVMRYSGQYGLEPELVTAILLVESSARPWARSPKGALGLMQVMPHMMDPLGLAGNASTIESNVEAGCWILANNIRRLGEDDGISTYFWGSRIRGIAYLDKVRAARAEVRALRPS